MGKRDFVWLFVVFIIISLFANKCRSRGEQIDQRDQIIDEKNSSIEEVELKNGKIAAQKLRVEGDLKTLKEGYLFLEDSLKSLGVKTRNLKSALFLAQETRGEGVGRIDTVEIQGEDETTLNFKINIEERFFKFSATIFPSHDYEYNYNLSDSLAIVNVTGRKNIFSKRVHSVRALNSNPKVKIYGLTSLTITEKRPRFHLGVTTGLTVNNRGLDSFIGVGVLYSFISF